MDASKIYDPEFRELIKSKKPTVIIPIGSIEQHGAHLPITTDSDIVTEIASRLAKKCKFIVFPTISYGVSEEHYPLFNASIPKYLLAQVIDEIIKSLKKNKIEWIIILNGHHGNGRLDVPISPDFIACNLKTFKPNPGVNAGQKRIHYFNYWDFMKRKFDHAGFVETSLMLTISDKVKMKKAKKGLITKGKSKKEIQKINKLASKPGGFPMITKNGVWGDPTGATKKDGEKFLVEIVGNLSKELREHTGEFIIGEINSEFNDPPEDEDYDSKTWSDEEYWRIRAAGVVSDDFEDEDMDLKLQDRTQRLRGLTLSKEEVEKYKKSMKSVLDSGA